MEQARNAYYNHNMEVCLSESVIRTKGKKSHCLYPSVEYVFIFLPPPKEKNSTNKIKALLVFICFSFMYPGSGDSDLESDFPLQNDRRPFVSVARNGIVLPSSGRSGNKNLNGKRNSYLRSLQQVSTNLSTKARLERKRSAEIIYGGLRQHS